MNVSLVFVVLLGLVAASLGDFIVIDTYAKDDMYCNTTHIARFYTNAFPCIFKRGVFVPEPCTTSKNQWVNYAVDYSYCGSETGPAELEGWQTVKVTGDPNCNFNETFYVLSAPSSLQNEYVIIEHPVYSTINVNITLSCNNILGVQSFSTCIPQYEEECFYYTVENNVCSVNTANTTYAFQTTCAAVPVAVPMAVPMASEPVSGPVAAPFKPPTKAPTSKTSAASLVYGSVAFLSLIALI